MLGSNQRPPLCKGRVILFPGFLRVTNCLQMAVFLDRSSSSVFSRFARVAAPNLLWMTLRTLSGGFAHYPLSTFNSSYDSQTALNAF